MFYDASKINKVLLCKHCVGGLDIPKMLQFAHFVRLLFKLLIKCTTV